MGRIRKYVRKRVAKEKNSFDFFMSVSTQDINSYIFWFMNGNQFNNKLWTTRWGQIREFGGLVIPNRRMIYELQNMAGHGGGLRYGMGNGPTPSWVDLSQEIGI